MAAAQAHLTDDADGPEDVPPLFREALLALERARPRPEVVLEPIPAPRRLAPYSHALEAAVMVDGAELADGRFVLLYDPGGQDAWRGTFRVVTLVRAELEPEIAADPLLPEVTWSWLTGALAARSVAYGETSGTVTHAGSHYFGRLAERAPESRVEIRASWTPGAVPARSAPTASSGPPAYSGPPGESAGQAGPPSAAPPASGAAVPPPSPSSPAPGTAAPETAAPEVGAHLAAWCELLCQCAGLPPESEGPDGPSGPGVPPGAAGGPARVVPLPQRRGPQPR